MTNRVRYLPSSVFCLALASLCGSVSAQSLGLTYQLDAGVEAQRASISNAGCASFRWVGSAGTCNQGEALGRFSRLPHDAEFASSPQPQKSVAPQPVAALPDSGVIPYLGESSSRAAADARANGLSVSDRDAASQPDLNLRFGARARSNASDDLERRLRNSAYESRADRNTFNAVGVQLAIPIQSRVHQSADPTPPQ